MIYLNLYWLLLINIAFIRLYEGGFIIKLLLIGPSRYNDDGTVFKTKLMPFPRLNLMHLAALTPKDVKVKIVEEIVENLDFETECDLVGITAYTSQAKRAFDIADEFRKMGKAVIIGGIHVSYLPNEAMKHADSVVIGEADYLWGQIIEDFKNNALKSIYKSTKMHDLKDLPIPRYDLAKRKKYFVSTMPVQTARGCPHNCDFCTVTRFFGNKYRIRPIDDVIRDIKAAGTKKFFFIDDNIIANRKYAKELFTKLIPLKILWNAQSTLNLGRFPDLCRLAAKSGCRMVAIGLESINQESLDAVNKKHNKVEEYYKLLKAIRNSGISVQLQMIVGLDCDDENIFEDTVKFVSKIKPIRTILNVPIPLPGTKMTADFESSNRILHKDWSKYRTGNVVFRPKLLSNDELETLTVSAFKKIYSIGSIISRSLSQPKRMILLSFVINFIDRRAIRLKGNNTWVVG